MNVGGCARRDSSGRFGGCRDWQTGLTLGSIRGERDIRRGEPSGDGGPAKGRKLPSPVFDSSLETTDPHAVRGRGRDAARSRDSTRCGAGCHRRSAFPTIGANEIVAPRSRRACPLKPPNHPPRASSGKRNKFAGQSGNPTAAAGRRVGHDSPMRCQRRTTTSVVASSRPYTRDARGRRVCGTAADGVRCFIQNRVGPYSYSYFTPCRVTVRTRRRSINPKSTRRSARRGAHHLGWRINIEISPKQALSYVHNSYFSPI